MRRSKRIATLVAGGTCLLLLSACEDDPEVFAGVEQCVAETGDRIACEADYAAALAAHRETAPKFADAARCEEIYGEGKCVPAPAGQTAGEQVAQGEQTAQGEQVAGGGGFFMPMMMGYMMGRMIGGASMPVYRDKSGYAYTSRAPGPATPDAMRAPSSRGGFGRTGGAFSSAG